MLCACVADAGGRPVGVGSRDERRALAPAFGAVPAAPEGADVVIEAAGTVEAWERALELVRPGGTVLAFGGLPREARVEIDPYRIHYEEVRLVGAFHHTPRTMRAALAFLASGAYPFERLVTHEVGLEGVAALFDDPPPRLPQGCGEALSVRRRRRGLRRSRLAGGRGPTSPSPDAPCRPAMRRRGEVRPCPAVRAESRGDRHIAP